MFEQSVATFEYLIREQRPVKEILHADYTFLNPALAKFYGGGCEAGLPDRRDGKGGGRLDLRPRRSPATGLGADHHLGTPAHEPGQARRLDPAADPLHPTPPPPADAGTLPADDKSFEGQTLRQRLASHKREPRCASCHLRIDPLGFPLEGFDAVGRRRQAYADGKPVDVTGEFQGRAAIVGNRPDFSNYLESQDRKVLTTVAREDAGLRPRPQPAAHRPRVDQRDGGGRRRGLDHGSGRPDRHQPAVRQPRSRGHRNGERGAAKETQARQTDQGAAHEPAPRHRSRPPSLPARRGSRPGPALDGIAARLRRHAGRPRGPGPSSAAARHRVLLERGRTRALVGEGKRRPDGAWSRRSSRCCPIAKT